MGKSTNIISVYSEVFWALKKKKKKQYKLHTKIIILLNFYSSVQEFLYLLRHSNDEWVDIENRLKHLIQVW